MLSSAAHWGEVTLLSLGLFLGTTDRATAQSTDSNAAEATKVLSQASIDPLSTESSALWGEYNQQSVTTFSAPDGSIRRLSIGANQISFEAPVAKECLSRVLENFCASDSLWVSNSRSVDGHQWSTYDGVIFIEKCAGLEKPVVRTPRGIFRLKSETVTTGNQSEIENARRLRGELINEFDPVLEQPQKNQFRNAFARAAEQAKFELLQEKITQRTTLYSELPYLHSLTLYNRQLLSDLKSGAIAGEQRQSQLDSLVKIYQIEFREIIAHSAAADCAVFRQLLIAQSLNDRYQAVLATSLSPESQAQPLVEVFKNEWRAITTMRGLRDGVVRLNDSKEQFDSVTGDLEKILLQYEEKLHITPPSTISRINQRMAQLETDLCVGRTLEPDRRIMTLDAESQGEFTCSYEIERDGDSTLKFSDQQRSTLERWHKTTKVLDWSSLPLVGQRKSVSYDPESGHALCNATWKEDSNGVHLVEYTALRKDGSVNFRESVDQLRCTFYDQAGKRVADLTHTADHKGIEYRWIFSTSGVAVSTWNVERLRQPAITDEQYLQTLAKVLDTPERIHFFLDLCMTYTPDGTSDHWQTPAETVKRIDKGVMLGDCEDYAFLARDILRRQGINAHAIYVPGHAECVWIQKDSQGRYHGQSLGTFGFDQDGITYQKEQVATGTEGFSTSREALQVLMKKYENGGLGLSQSLKYEINPQNIQLADFSTHPHLAHQIFGVPLSYFVRE